jgi:hypothetical protein
MTPKGGTPSMGAAHTPTPEDALDFLHVCSETGDPCRRASVTVVGAPGHHGWACMDCERTMPEEPKAEAYQSAIAALAAGRDAAEKLVSAQHDALVAMNAERDWWEHRAEVSERENGEALAMLAFTGEPSSLWQAAAAARVKLSEAEREAARVDSQWRELYLHRLEEVITLRAKLDALTAHMNQVHETLGGSDTALTLEAAQHVVAKLAEAERERGDADDALAACQAQAAGTIAQLRAKLDECVVALRDIATNYDHEAQTREHTKGYGGCCRVCTAETTLRIVARTAATEQGE